MSVAIKVENLSKKYIISHEKTSASYETFGETLIQGSKNVANKIIHPFSGKQLDSQTQEEFWALKDINFEINQGDKVGIIGRNGAGKSTLLKILSRITDPTGGKIHINGRIASLLEVGTGFHPELTGRENIFLNGAILGMNRKEIKAKFDEIVDFSEVDKFLDTPVKRYSSGMYVRLAFAVAAHLEPEILVVDEVLAVGDAEFQKKCLGKMNDVSKKGRTILFVSHNIGMIAKLCDRGICLKNGRVMFDGNINDCISSYQNSTNILMDKSFKVLKDDSTILENITVNSKINDGYSLPTFNKDLVFEVEFTLLKKLSFVSFHFGIDTAQGIRVTTIDSRFNKFEIDTLYQGKYKLNISLTNIKLMPGRYIVSKFMIRDCMGEVSIFVDEITSFLINEVIDRAPVGTGCLLGKANWSID